MLSAATETSTLPMPVETKVLIATPSKRLFVLVIGMAYVSEQTAELASKTIRVNTTSSLIRDRHRLLALEKDHSCHVMSLNMAQKEAQCEPGRHIEAALGRRAAHSLADRLAIERKSQPFDHIYTDYFRCGASVSSLTLPF